MALRHLPSGNAALNSVWVWAAPAGALDLSLQALGRVETDDRTNGKPCAASSSPLPARVLVTHDATSPVDSVLSVHVGDGVEAACTEAQRLGYEIVHPLTPEPWGVRRSFVRDPDGNVINIVSHGDD
jgi:catechol 2,3-dioxygenase-like lactoylglutathione lyase family enzyme